MFLISFGGWFFLALAVLFLVTQSVLLFNNNNRTSLGVLAAYVAAMFFLVDDWPTFNYRWLVVYPGLAALWLPVYWYLDLIRRASKIKSLIIQYGDLDYVWSKSGEDIRRDLSGGHVLESVKANIKHPSVDDLFCNCLLFPISIPLFFGENAVRMTIDYLRQWMEQIRLKINASVNSFRG
jgi:hypothetical protein